ncbi:MAG: phosphate signaling complex protein PhoU [Clostridia bacterium]|jgi:phosphate transport system protein|nr:phosphate signaling complex protein PhoU [Clostridia bacterium]
MRFRFDAQLEQLKTQMIEMGSLCETAILNATKALVNGDLDLAREVIKTDEKIDQEERNIENLCLKLLLQQQPVARDLRRISSALKIITDMERIGDQAADISEITILANIRANDNTKKIEEMADATIKMVTDSIDAYVRQDLDLAKAVLAYDDIVDSLFDYIRDALIESISKDKENNDRENSISAIDLIMIAKYLERIGDHATNIAEWVIFSITGEHISEDNI